MVATPDQIIAHVNDYQKPVVVTRVKPVSTVNFEDAAASLVHFQQILQHQMNEALKKLMDEITKDMMQPVIKSDWFKHQAFASGVGVDLAKKSKSKVSAKKPKPEVMWIDEIVEWPSDVYAPMTEYGGRRSGKTLRSELLAGAYGNVKIKDDFRQIVTNTIA